ncbi:uncharacterized protein LOC108162145 [Drosophila miranda]|uniref:uncharacterized protein LOC108162145 n=1 Tax=Drosophila miranda TaxID=7229 RepID=UPI0007E7801C|nr:uncharacterized protein LOC108162145 [Drosophila miranda]
MFKSNKLRDEESGLDSGLDVCKQLRDNLEDCLNIVERLNQRYNGAPVEGPPSVSSSQSSGDFLLQPQQEPDPDPESETEPEPELEVKAGVRTGQEVYSSYVDMYTKYMKLKRELNATVSHAKQINELANGRRNNDYNIPEERSPPARRM